MHSEWMAPCSLLPHPSRSWRNSGMRVVYVVHALHAAHMPVTIAECSAARHGAPSYRWADGTNRPAPPTPSQPILVCAQCFDFANTCFIKFFTKLPVLVFPSQRARRAWRPIADLCRATEHVAVCYDDHFTVARASQEVLAEEPPTRHPNHAFQSYFAGAFAQGTGKKRTGEELFFSHVVSCICRLPQNVHAPNAQTPSNGGRQEARHVGDAWCRGCRGSTTNDSVTFPVRSFPQCCTMIYTRVFCC